MRAVPLLPMLLFLLAALAGCAHGPDSRYHILYGKAVSAYQKGQYPEAISLLRRAMDLRASQQTVRGDGPREYRDLAEFYYADGRYAEAAALYEQALALIEQAPSASSEELAAVLSNLAGIYRLLDRPADAERSYLRAVSLDDRTPAPPAGPSLLRLNNLALFYKSRGRYQDAEKLYRRALDRAEHQLGARHPDTVTTTVNLAALLLTTGRYGEAEALLGEARRRAEGLSLSSSDRAHLLDRLAQLYLLTGRYAEAAGLYQQVLQLQRTGGSGVEAAMTLTSLGYLRCRLGEHAEAARLDREAIARYEALLGPDHPEVATVLNNLAYASHRMGEDAEAKRTLQRALRIAERPGAPARLTPYVLKNLAEVTAQPGTTAEALGYVTRALSLAEDCGEPALKREVYRVFSLVLERDGNRSGAIFFAKLEVDVLRKMRDGMEGAERSALNSFTGSVSSSYQRLAGLLVTDGRTAEAQQVLAMLKQAEYLEFARGAAASAGAGIPVDPGTDLRWLKEYEAASAQCARLGRELADLREKQKKALSTDRDVRPLAAREQELVRLAEEVKAAEEKGRVQTALFNTMLATLLERLREDAKRRAAVSSEAQNRRLEELGEKNLARTAALRSTLRALGEGAVVLHYLITDDRLHIILTTANSQVARHHEIPAAELNREIVEFRAALSDPRADPRPVARSLYRVLISPIAAELEQSGAKTLMLSLDGYLRYIPFAALLDGDRYLVERYPTVLYSEVARDKVALPVEPLSGVAALGVSKEHTVKTAWDTVQLPRLPAVPDEVSGIVKDAAGSAGGPYLDEQFTEEMLQSAGNVFPVVHIASHFRFAPGNSLQYIGENSFLLLGDGRALTLARLRDSNFFQNTELLTLSACETALGAEREGGEVESLGALAMGQGAKAVIATLWTVADRSTSLLMKDFYRRKSAGRNGSPSKAEALRQSQLALLRGAVNDPGPVATPDRGVVRWPQPSPEGAALPGDREKQFAHPYYWAPFVLMGNWK